MDEFYNKHYIRTRVDGAVIDCWSDGPNPDRDIADAICINEEGGYQFRLFPGGEENPALYTMDGVPLYHWDGQAVQRRTDEEIGADRAYTPTPSPTAQEQLRADVDFLAALQGVIL